MQCHSIRPPSPGHPHEGPPRAYRKIGTLQGEGAVAGLHPGQGLGQLLRGSPRHLPLLLGAPGIRGPWDSSLLLDTSADEMQLEAEEQPGLGTQEDEGTTEWSSEDGDLTIYIHSRSSSQATRSWASADVTKGPSAALSMSLENPALLLVPESPPADVGGSQVPAHTVGHWGRSQGAHCWAEKGTASHCQAEVAKQHQWLVEAQLA